MKLDPLRHLANPLALLAVIAINALANLLPLGGRTTGEVSGMFPTLFTPAPFTFSIWAVIYLGLTVFVVYQLLPLSRSNPAISRIGPLFAISCILNIAWLFAWHFLNLGLSVIIIVALLLTLIVIYLRIRVPGHEPRGLERLALRAPFSIYLGWISVATIANTSVWLQARNWTGWGIPEPGWALIMLAVSALLAYLMLLRRNDSLFSLVIIWALAGIAAAQSETPLVMLTAIILGLLLLALLAYRIYHARPGPRTGAGSATGRKPLGAGRESRT
jgi:hypothetical protein